MMFSVLFAQFYVVVFLGLSFLYIARQEHILLQASNNHHRDAVTIVLMTTKQSDFMYHYFSFLSWLVTSTSLLDHNNASHEFSILKSFFFITTL
jgi:hypothetical protein